MGSSLFKNPHSTAKLNNLSNLFRHSPFISFFHQCLWYLTLNIQFLKSRETWLTNDDITGDHCPLLARTWCCSHRRVTTERCPRLPDVPGDPGSPPGHWGPTLRLNQAPDRGQSWHNKWRHLSPTHLDVATNLCHYAMFTENQVLLAATALSRPQWCTLLFLSPNAVALRS